MTEIEVFILAVPIFGFAFGLWIGRAWVMAVTPLVWVIFWIGELQGWWDFFSNENWPIPLISNSAMAVGGTAVGIFARRLLRQRAR